jgi:hypothetical protein
MIKVRKRTFPQRHKRHRETILSGKSKYLDYFPPVLWETESTRPGNDRASLSVGSFLQIFEKILTGIEDSVSVDHTISHSDGTTEIHEHDGIEHVIAHLHRLFDPRTTPPAFLKWLASWLGLRLSSYWSDEYEVRKLISEFSRISCWDVHGPDEHLDVAQRYQQAGPKAALDRLVDLYRIGPNRPRIAIDDCSKVLLCEPQPDRFAPIRTLISQGPSVRYDPGQSKWVLNPEADGLVMPLCLALAPDGSLIVGDLGTPSDFSPEVKKGVWRLPPPQSSGKRPNLVRLGSKQWNLQQPVALATDDVAANWTLYVLDGGTPATLYRLTENQLNSEAKIEARLDTELPVAMVRDRNGHLLILDRGNDSLSGQAMPKIIDVDVSATPVAVTTIKLPDAVDEPLSLSLQPNGDLLIGDGGKLNQATGDLVRIDRNNSTELTATRLMVPDLIAPVAIASADTDSLYVLDAGLKPLRPHGLFQSSRVSARAAAVYRVCRDSERGYRTTRVSEARGLVFPTGMVRDGGVLYVCDRGEHRERTKVSDAIVWRARPHQFGVVVHFQGRPASEDETRDRARLISDISEFIRARKPAHTIATFAYDV